MRKFTTKKKLTGIAKTFKKWSEWEEGDQVIGKWVADHKDQYDHVCPVLEVEYAKFADKKFSKEVVGKNLVLNASGTLTKQLYVEKNAQHGDILQLTYMGTSMIEKGKYKGKEAHNLEIEVLVEEGSEEETTEDEDLV